MTEQTLRDLNQAFDACEELEESFRDTRHQLLRLINDERGPGHLFDALDRAIGQVESSLSRSVNRALACCGLDLVDGQTTIAHTSFGRIVSELQKAIRTSLGYFDGPAKFRGSFESTWSDFTTSIEAMPLEELKRSYSSELRRADEFLNSLPAEIAGGFDCNRLSIKALSESEVCEKIEIEYENQREMHQKLEISPEQYLASQIIDIGWKS